MFFSFYNCLFEKWHSMRVSNPLLSNHASCITVENCVVLLILLCRNAKTVELSVSSNLRHLKRNSSVTVIETALCLCTRIPELHLHCFLLINRGSVPLGSTFFIFFWSSLFFFCQAVCVCGGKRASHAPWIRRHWNIHAPWCRSLVKGFSELQYKDGSPPGFISKAV